MLVIRDCDGSLAGATLEIDPQLDRVTFGRQLDCQVVFDPEHTLVSRQHFALVRKPPGPAGHWTIELFGEPFVAVNGVPADFGQRVPPSAKFELGKIGGPSFTVDVVPDPPVGNLELTAKQQDVEPPRLIAIRADTAARYARWVGGAALVVAVAGGATALYNQYSARADALRFSRSLQGLDDRLAREANLRIGADIRAHLARAVYHVQLQDRSGGRRSTGTAWVVGPHLLATNSHVALARQGLRTGEKLIVRAPGPNGKVYEVVEHKLHPAYAPFIAFVRSDRRFLRTFRNNLSELGFINGYDVATLRVREDLPANAILELASADDLRALSAGSSVGTAGYPSENLVSSSALLLGVTPELHVGTVTGLTDFFLLPTDANHQQLVHHDLPSTGGASGSPIVGSSGRVVALLSAGNMFGVDGRRIPNAALINYGQRVDMLRDLIAGQAEEKIAADRQYWARRTAPYDVKGADFFPELMVSSSNPKRGEERKSVTPILLIEKSPTLEPRCSLTTTIKKDDYCIRDITYRVSLPPGYDYTLLAYATQARFIRMDFMAGDKVERSVSSVVGRPSITCTVPKSEDKPSRTHCPAPKTPATANGKAEYLVRFSNILPVDDPLATEKISFRFRVYRWNPTKPNG
jgi:Trypsin-like peptidase domain/FHA domain